MLRLVLLPWRPWRSWRMSPSSHGVAAQRGYFNTESRDRPETHAVAGDQ